MRALTSPQLAVGVLGAVGVALGISACQHVASFSQPTLVRVIDASYAAPAVNVYVEKTLFASNVGVGFVSNYGTASPSLNGQISITAVTGGAPLASTATALNAAAQHSVFLTDNSANPTQYTLTTLEDQRTPAPSGQSDFRFLNQALRTGAVDVYMVPGDSTLADSVPLCKNLTAGTTCGYVGFPSQSVTMVITPTGSTKPKYSSDPITLTGGEVRTAVIVDSQLTSDPPVQVVMAKDVN